MNAELLEQFSKLALYACDGDERSASLVLSQIKLAYSIGVTDTLVKTMPPGFKQQENTL